VLKCAVFSDSRWRQRAAVTFRKR